MPLLTVGLCVLLLILMISWGKVSPFLSFLVVSLLAGALLGMPLVDVAKSVQKGIGHVDDGHAQQRTRQQRHDQKRQKRADFPP